MQRSIRWKLLLKALAAAIFASAVVAFCFVEWFYYYMNSYMPLDYLVHLALHPNWGVFLEAFCLTSVMTIVLGIPVSMLLQRIKRPGIAEHMLAAIALLLPLIVAAAMNSDWLAVLEVTCPGLAAAAFFWLIRRPDCDKPLAEPI